MKNILITGGSGFLGKNLINHIHSWQMPDQKELLNSYGDYYLYYTESRKEQKIPWDLSNEEDVQALLEACKPDIIVHLAANPLVKPTDNISGMLNDNINATAYLAKHSKPDCHFIFTSSVVVYGNGNLDFQHKEYNIAQPTSLYGVSKVAAEDIIKFYKPKNHTILRLCATVGPNLTHGVIFDFIQKLKTKDKLEIIGNYPGTIKPYLHVDDFCMVIEKLIKNPHPDDKHWTYNICNSYPITIDQVADAVMDGLGIHKEKVWIGNTWAGDNPIINCSNYEMCINLYRPRWDSIESIRRAVSESVVSAI